jgi:hypothetical protein
MDEKIMNCQIGHSVFISIFFLFYFFNFKVNFFNLCLELNFFSNEGYMVQSLKTNCLNGQTEVGIFK